VIVDCHVHLNPATWNADSRPQSFFDIPAYLEKQEAAGIAASVFNNNFIGRPGYFDMYQPRFIREYHDWAAEVTAKHGHRLQGLAAADPFADPEGLRETERAVRECGFKGVLVNTSVNGEYLDSPRADGFFQLMRELKVPIFLHPPGVTVGAEHMGDWRLIEMIGRPFDSVLNLARMIHGGVFDRYPDLTFICAHVGGAITALAGRLDFGYEMRNDPAFGPWGATTAEHPPSWYIKKLLVDTMGFHAPHVQCAVDTIGADHVVFGSDYPPVPIPLERSIRTVRDLRVSEAERELIFSGNARRILGWP
jgi:aminocarboxymuconate-semialdehyde decarboxylase